MWSLLGIGEQKLVQMVQVTWQRWPPCPYMVKTIKDIFFWNRKADDLETVQHWVLEYYQVCSNDAAGLTLTYFTAKSNLVLYAFVLEKVKTMNFSETILVYGIKVGRCSQLNERFMSTKGQGHSLTLVQITQINIFKLLPSITSDFNTSVFRWAIQDQWSSGFPFSQLFMIIHLFWAKAVMYSDGPKVEDRQETIGSWSQSDV